MDRLKRKPGYLAILPPKVRYDRALTPNAKLLYAEISAMSDVTGFCWASNDYLASLFSISVQSVTRLVAQLAERGYVETQMCATATGSERRIFMTDLGTARLPPVLEKTRGGLLKNEEGGLLKNEDTPLLKNEERGLRKNEERGLRIFEDQNDKSINNNPPIVPPGGRRRNEHRDTTTWMSAEFEKLWMWYPTGDNAMHPKRGSRQRAIRAWDQLHPSVELIGTIALALAAQAESREWQEGIGIPHLSTYLNGYRWEGWERGDAT